jgi:hypothetical protein
LAPRRRVTFFRVIKAMSSIGFNSARTQRMALT